MRQHSLQAQRMPSSVGLNRREMLRAASLAGIGLTLGCGSLRTLQGQVEAVADTFEGVSSRHPNLPGIRQLRSLHDEVVRHMSEEDLAILGGALYLDAQSRLRNRKVSIDQPALRDSLAQPLDLSAFSLSYFQKTVEEAREKMSVDPGYRADLEAAQTTVEPRRRKCGLLCWIIIIIIVIIIIILA